jgi:hypothetical protein
VVPIPERNFMTYQLVHEKTGARLFHVDCSDTNNVFWFAILAFVRLWRSKRTLTLSLTHSSVFAV